jgi:copper chaperone
MMIIVTPRTTAIELTLPDMSCGHCVKVVTQTVARLDPAAKLQIDLPAQRVQIESKTQARQAFADALAEQGYPAA